MDILNFILLGGATISLGWFILIYQPRERKKYFNKKLEKVHFIYSTMNKVVQETGAELFLILKSENGGGVPRFGNQLYISPIFRVSQPPFSAGGHELENMQTDGQIIELLKKIYDSGDTAFFTSNMQPGFLQEIFIDKGINWAYAFWIGQDELGSYCGLIATSKPNTPFQDSQGVEIKMAVNAIRGKFREVERMNKKVNFFNLK